MNWRFVRVAEISRTREATCIGIELGRHPLDTKSLKHTHPTHPRVQVIAIHFLTFTEIRRRDRRTTHTHTHTPANGHSHRRTRSSRVPSSFCVCCESNKVFICALDVSSYAEERERQSQRRVAIPTDAPLPVRAIPLVRVQVKSQSIRSL